MAKQPRQGRPFERRNGQEGFSWEGVATKVDPAGTPPNRPRDLVNVRIQGGVIISRPPFHAEGGYVPLIPIHDAEALQVVPDDTPPYDVVRTLVWVPHWLGDHTSAAGVKLFAVSEPEVFNGFASIAFIDTDADLPMQLLANLRIQIPGYALPIEKFNNEFYFGDFAGLRKLYLVPSNEGAGSPPINTSQLADEVIFSYPGFRTGALQEHEGKLFIAITAGGPGEIFTWDGLSAASEFVMTSTGVDGSVMVVYKDTLVVAMRNYVGAGQGALLVRDATGTWSTVTLVGFNPSRLPCSIAEYGNLLYILDGVNKIFTWDGSVIALAHTIPGIGNSLQACAKLAGRLYYAWFDPITPKAELGIVDQDNIIASRYNDYGTRTGVNGAVVDNVPIIAMAQYRGRLWCSFNHSNGIYMRWHSVQYAPFDGWQESGDLSAFTDNLLPAGMVTNLRTL